MIEYASEKDLSAILQLWNECFGDDEKYIRFFLDGHRAPCIIYRQGGEAVSMLFLLSGSVRIDGELYRAEYIYAACTATAHRGKGYMGELIKFAKEQGAKAGVSFICLVPSEKSLFDYYARFGFVTAFKKQIVRVKRDKLQALACHEQVECVLPDFKKLTDLRNSLCNDAFLWSSQALEYAFSENEFCGGKNLCVSDFSGYAILRDDKLIEAFYLPESLLELLKLILSFSKEESFEISGPCGSLDFADAVAVDNAMLCPLNGLAALAASIIKDAYLGLALE